ncbi:G2/M phase-specific E3 ubiquitin-protein ligase [Fasciola gigantica]|uniref:G2/M phase-specific E3 ubiquitin-protein ligase n=1 Tax=Fasciola gigantica TaxID=46835 RepID=A0A504YAN1_FASGI|nr:G2/M phase-specific E3 ubiquitin-protein ligase [Fasciola gigantica]
MPRKKPPPKIVEELCGFCQQEEEHPLLGALVKTDEVVLHSNCIFAASGLSQDKEDGKTEGEYVEGFHISAIRKELKRGRLLHCCHCHRYGASVGCVVGSCPRSFHLPCITKAMGVTIFEDPFPSYCKKHAPRQDLKPWFRMNEEVPLCCICLFSILPEDSSGDSTPSSKHSDATSASPTRSTPVPKSTVKLMRAPRRSCVTVSTPKCIQISSGMSSVKRKLSLSNSTWELPDSPPHPDTSELDETLSTQTPCHKATIPNLPHIPAWLENYLIKLPSRHRSSAYETWQYNTVHGMCCPKAWMHRSCITGFAVTAALHYVKCPYCADKQTFIRSIIDAGIWVPDRYVCSFCCDSVAYDALLGKYLATITLLLISFLI